MMITALFLLGTLTATPSANIPHSVHETAEAPAKAPRGRKPQDPNKVICKSEAVIGSRTNVKKTCHTRAEWRELEGNTTSNVREFQREGRANGTIGG